MRYTLSQIAGITNGTLHGRDRTVREVSTDSRNRMIAPAEELFVAVSGANHDGHDYVNCLYERGVRGFLVEKLPDEFNTCPEAGFVVVANSLEALQELAGYHREQYKGVVVGITGSNGKTIVKEWFAQWWPGDRKGKLFRSPKSYNSQLGVALSLLMIEGDEPVAVIEAGISQPGEMDKLERMIRPDIGVLTHMGEAHRENFDSKAHKTAEKRKLFTRASHVVDLSASAFADANAENRAIVAAIYQALGIEPVREVDLQPVAMRLELREGILGSTLIDDSYNSDLTSLEIALNFLNQQAGAAGHHGEGEIKKGVVLSDILQSGLKEEELYGKVAAMLQAHGVVDFTGIGTGIRRASHLFGHLKRRQFFRTTQEFLQHADRSAFAQMYVLIKGSRSFGFEKITRFLEKKTHTTTLEVNLTAMSHNLNRYRAMLAPGTKVMAMVKACGYGSGATEVAAMLQHEGVDYLGVAFADEGVALREGGIHVPIVVLNSDPGSFAVMADHGLEPEIYSLDSLQAYTAEIRRRGINRAGVHLKLDTGMHRLGFEEKDLPELIGFLTIGDGRDALRVRSIFSHLAAAEDPAEDAFTGGQIACFERLSGMIVEALEANGRAGERDIIRHICNSAAVRRFPWAHFDMVRLGIGLYGTEGTEQTGAEAVSTLKTQIVQIKILSQGETVGYNRKGVVPARGMRVATIPIGYADGMDRRLGNGVGRVNVGGVLCPTIGNVCMDTCMVDITEVTQARVGDQVIIFGSYPTARTVARWLGTISYEVLTSVSARIRRIYTRD